MSDNQNAPNDAAITVLSQFTFLSDGSAVVEINQKMRVSTALKILMMLDAYHTQKARAQPCTTAQPSPTKSEA